MEVLNERVAFLSNYEVFTVLKEVKNPKANVATIVYETSQYLEGTPCKHQNPKVMEAFLSKLLPYKLTKTEKLQLLNLRPTTQVEMYLIIEDIEDRFTEEEIQALLATVSHLPNSTGVQQPSTSQETPHRNS